MKLLFVIPHCCASATRVAKYGSQTGDTNERGMALRQTVLALHQLLGPSQAMIQVGARCTIQANQPRRHELHVCVITNNSDHALEEAALLQGLFERVVVDVPPMTLGFACHRVLGDRYVKFDYCGYLEDDLILHDPWFLEKLIWFNRHVGIGSVLLPNRFELSADRAYQKCYLDGDLKPHVTQPFQDVKDEPRLSSKFLGRSIEFQRPLNPHSGCFFLNAEQMKVWSSRADFGVAKEAFIGPLESAASLGLMQTFKVYKPAIGNANFFEIEHHGERFVSKVRKAPSLSMRLLKY